MTTVRIRFPLERSYGKASHRCGRKCDAAGAGAAALATRLTNDDRLAGDYFGTQATMTLMATPCRCGRNVARLSSSKTKVPPGLRAWVLRIRSLASQATVQAWRHSPSTKRMTVPPGPAGPAGPAGPGGPCSPFSPWGPASCGFSSQADSAESANSTGIINRRTCMGARSLAIRAGYGAQEVKIAFRCVKGLLAPQRPCPRAPEAAAEALSPSFRLAAPAGNPFAHAVSEREPNGQSHGQVKYQGRHDHRLGNNH